LFFTTAPHFSASFPSILPRNQFVRVGLAISLSACQSRGECQLGLEPPSNAPSHHHPPLFQLASKLPITTFDLRVSITVEAAGFMRCNVSWPHVQRTETGLPHETPILLSLRDVYMAHNSGKAEWCTEIRCVVTLGDWNGPPFLAIRRWAQRRISHIKACVCSTSQLPHPQHG